uniref:Ovule protein n=1 Tax=Heterorhabditis bacteriophora TaxID=37862 RepID=A0A1I7WFM2_HETBA
MMVPKLWARLRSDYVQVCYVMFNYVIYEFLCTQSYYIFFKLYSDLRIKKKDLLVSGQNKNVVWKITSGIPKVIQWCVEAGPCCKYSRFKLLFN